MEKVTIDNYVDNCLKTWGGEFQSDRSELGMIGEWGEVAEVQKKFLRGDFNEAERDRRLCLEIGDVMYYGAILMHLEDAPFNDYIARSIKTLNKTDYKSKGITDVIVYSDWDIIIVSCLALLDKINVKLEDCLQANIDKLSDRQTRNVIKGSGDNR